MRGSLAWFAPKGSREGERWLYESSQIEQRDRGHGHVGCVFSLRGERRSGHYYRGGHLGRPTPGHPHLPGEPHDDHRGAYRHPPLRAQASSTRRLAASVLVANAISYAGLVLALTFCRRDAYRETYVLGEVAVTIFEATLIGALVRNQLRPGLGALRRHPLLCLVGLVVLANVITSVLGQALGLLAYAVGLEELVIPIPGGHDFGP